MRLLAVSALVRRSVSILRHTSIGIRNAQKLSRLSVIETPNKSMRTANSIGWCCLCLASSLTTRTIVTGLPWTRGGNNLQEEEDDTKNLDAPASAAVDSSGQIVDVEPQNVVNRNDIVEQFFRSSTADEKASSALRDDIREQAGELAETLVKTRRALHQFPELMYQEEQTSAQVKSILTELNINYTSGWAVNTHTDVMPGPGGFGVVADIGTGKEPCVLLRADMDALPILEKTEGIDAFKSRTDNKMHACGHDGHTTMLLGAASILKSMEDSINGTVRVMFQPAEEGGAGAKRMREEGILEKDPKPSHGFGLHVWPTLPSGTVASRPGPLLAACERFEILIAGVGGHAAMPHLTVDPIVTASAVVMNLQTIVSRTISPLESGVCSITKIDGGDAFNVIPHAVLMRGTIRALSTETLLTLRDRVQHIVESTAATHGCNVTITYSPDFYPPTVNDPELFSAFSKDVGALVSSEGRTRDTEPTMGAEDFAFVAEKIPSTFFLLGQGSGTDPPTNFGLHHPHFALDESVLPRGVELHVNLALRALHELQTENGRLAMT